MAKRPLTGSDEDRQCRILIVDDLNSSRVLIESILRSAGFTQLVTAADGVEAIEAIREETPDMLVLDIVMPRMDGFEVCRHVREALGLDIPILVQTGVQEGDFKVRAFDSGASDLVSKPINAGELVSRVKLHLERRRMIGRLQTYQRRMEEDLGVAQAMQHSLLMSDAEVATIVGPRGCDMQTRYQASNTLGGDLWQIFPVDETRFGLFMVDLSGHGVTAAINAFRVHMLAAEQIEERRDPSAWMERLNESLVRILPVEHFATGFYALIDPALGCLDYVSAGAPPPLLVNAHGKVRWLDQHGTLLGCRSGVGFEATRETLRKGDRLFVYSDALYEDFETPQNTLSAEKLARGLVSALGVKSDFSSALMQSLFGTPDRRFRDDLTWLLVEMKAQDAQA